MDSDHFYSTLPARLRTENNYCCELFFPTDCSTGQLKRICYVSADSLIHDGWSGAGVGVGFSFSAALHNLERFRAER